MWEVRVITPTGSLGLGFDRGDFRRCLSEERIEAIAVDSGSSDPGPYYLGAGKPFMSRIEAKADLRAILGGAIAHDLPVVVGTAGGSGARPHVDWMRDIIEELARENGWNFRMAMVYADVDPETLARRLHAGDVREFESGSDLTPEVAAATTRVVAQMGPEPIMEALRMGAQVVLAGRSCDDAVVAAYPMLKGADPALALHMGKILECGALAAEPISMDVMMGFVARDHFDLVPGSPSRACTPTSVAAHSLYERENPILQRGPGGTIDLSETSLEQVDARTVRVSGTTYRRDPEYLVKLEGARMIGHRSIVVAGIRCPAMIERLDACLEEGRRRTLEFFGQAGVDGSRYRIAYHVYGRDAVMKELEPKRHRLDNHEYGLVMEAVADSEELSSAIVRHLRGRLLHLDFPGQFNNSGNLAILYSPSVVNVGEVYEFSVYHLLRLDDPRELFPIEIAEVRGGRVVAAGVAS